MVLLAALGWHCPCMSIAICIIISPKQTSIEKLIVRISAVNQYNGAVTLAEIADLYETLGKFLKDLGQLNQVC